MCVGFAAQGFWTLETNEREMTQAALFNSKIVVCTILHPIFALLSGLHIFCHNWALSFGRDISEDSPCSKYSLNSTQDACSSTCLFDILVRGSQPIGRDETFGRQQFGVSRRCPNVLLSLEPNAREANHLT